ncbi:molybdenum cofactor sulfurase 1-like [Neltuma alba]|uniref:molybdenum cofactor sulfurase 1-like n=1 Tax=Neltuma alba TaxID=207710 RepID=UPI0010A4CB1D|nr:molybdenum cofactor sulfurase 1-like [Prosopis alba]
MHSPCAGEASTPCFNGCFSSSFLASEESHADTSVNEIRSGYDFVAVTCSTLHPNAQFTNHEALPSLHESYLNFTKAYPLYSNTLKADQIRAQEYYHLNFSNLCFDYTGYGLFSYAQQQQSWPGTSMAASSSSHHPPLIPLELPFFDISYKSVNLHSQVVYGGEESELETSIRERIMAFMNFSEDDYSLVFTANHTCAFKLLADSFQFTPNGNLLTVYDHKSDSLDEMTKSCNKQGINIMSAEFSWPDLRINMKKLRKMMLGKRDKKKRGLFVFPVHSRVTGSPYSYMWMSMAQENGWHVLLDACALAPKEINTLGLSLFKPDFLVCSFYKIYGENPSGFGCLFVKKSSISALNDSPNATSIGIVSLIPALRKPETISDEQEIVSEHQSEPKPSKSLETCGRLEVELKGLDHADEVGLVGISSRGRYLVNWVIRALMSLQHPSSETGFPLLKIYGSKINPHRGHAIAFNVFDWKGEKIDPFLVQKLADRNNISLSNAILQNVKMNEQDWCEVNGVGQPRKKTMMMTKQDCGISVLTASLNFLTNFEDVYKLWSFLSRFLDADFVEKERWRYMALNQETLEV